MDPQSWPLSRIACARHRRAGAGGRQLHLFRAFHRRAAGLDLRAGAYRGRQIRAGDDEVSARPAAPTAACRRGMAERGRAAAAARTCSTATARRRAWSAARCAMRCSASPIARDRRRHHRGAGGGRHAACTAAGFKPVPTGIEHGTVTVVIDKHPFEVTTLRQDVETYGRHAKVAFGRDWQADAERRDFTINALSVTRDGTVYDYVGGLDDLAARRVRFIGDAQPAHRGRLSAHPALLPFPCRLRQQRSSRSGRACRLHRRPRRARPALARARAHGDDEAAWSRRTRCRRSSP